METCSYCRNENLGLVDGLCLQCRIDKHRGFEVLKLAGRCANGAERGGGKVWHAVPFGQKAKCGATYGRLSAGWSNWKPLNQNVTCPKCLAILERGLTPLAPEKSGDSTVQQVLFSV